MIIGMLFLAGNSQALDKEVSLLTRQSIGELAVAGRLSVDLHSEFMVSRTYEKETVLNWYNCGYSGGGNFNTVGGNFGDFGLHVPYTEREKRYPHAVSNAGIRCAVRFDGGDIMKGNFSVEKNIAGRRNMAIEVWFRDENPQPGEIMLGWQSREGREISASVSCSGKIKPSDKWRHLVVNCTSEKEDWYIDGAKVASGSRATVIAEGHVMVLGGASASKPSFAGDLAAVRLHDAAMTEEEIGHNCKGGVMLGAEMHNWWRLEPDKWWVKESEHFRHCVDKKEMEGWNENQLKEFNTRTADGGPLWELAERNYHTYSERLAMRSSVVSRKPEMRGDGIKYKTPIQPAGGSFMGCDDNFGWACQGAGHCNPHELVHGWQAMTGGALQGNWWEAHANFPQTYNGIYQTMPPSCCSRVCEYFPANGRDFYHERLMFEHLAQTPEYGPMFISKMWYDGATEVEKNPYPWTIFTRVDPDPSTSLAYEYSRMIQRNVTWDYQTFREGPGCDGVQNSKNLYREEAAGAKADILRYSRIILKRIPYFKDWWRVPKEMSPQQLGWNICPLKIKDSKVSVTLYGYVNSKRGSDWRLSFVGVDAGDKPVYSRIAVPGEALSFETGPGIKELYLTVCAIPTNLIAINMTGDFRSFEQEPFPYMVKLQGCEPLDVMIPEKPKVTGGPHSSGGGFVESRAQVEASAYVGPNAQVIGNSKVMGNARILDYAVVQDSTVRDNAIVSGHAQIANGSIIQDYAKVRDYARVWHATIKDQVKILEHAEERDKTCSGNAVLKGGAISFGNVSGNSMIDGSYCKGNEVTKGKWFTWSWGNGKNPGEIDEEFGGIYMRMLFETPHEWMAIDDFGATWGYLVDKPEYVTGPDIVTYKSSLVEPESVVPALEGKRDFADNFAELLIGYLLPPEDGDYTFWIAADDEGEFWLGKAGSDNADKKLCSNPFYAEYKNYKKFPSQKSESVRLEKGKAYPLRVLHGDNHMGDSMSVAWNRGGSDKPEIVGSPHLSVTADGKQPGVIRRAWKGVSKPADLVKLPDYPAGRIRVDGGALALNGVNQFVELQKDVADMRDITIKTKVKWTGSAGERIFEFFNDKGDSAYLSPSIGGNCVFVISVNGKQQVLKGPALKSGKWTELAVVLSGDTGKLVVDGVATDKNSVMTLNPDDINATECYLGRGRTGGYFKGLIDSFEIYSLPLEN